MTNPNNHRRKYLYVLAKLVSGVLRVLFGTEAGT